MNILDYRIVQIRVTQNLGVPTKDRGFERVFSTIR